MDHVKDSIFKLHLIKALQGNEPSTNRLDPAFDETQLEISKDKLSSYSHFQVHFQKSSVFQKKKRNLWGKHRKVQE